jgi:hypothetical protein
MKGKRRQVRSSYQKKHEMYMKEKQYEARQRGEEAPKEKKTKQTELF